MPDLLLFVSHVSEDRPVALEIVGELERRGVACWIAPRDVRPGKPFDDEIVKGIEACRAMLLIFSEHSNEHEYIRREITVAGESHKVIIPFRIENAQPRRGLRVRLSDLHWIDGFVSRERAIDQVIRAIDPARVRQQEEHHQQTLSQAQEDAEATALQKGDKAYEQENYTEAMRWYRKAADQGSTEAQRHIGLLYERGSGVARDYTEAMRWYRKAADQGDSSAQFYIGQLYERGSGVWRNYAEAMRWYRKAADQGDSFAQYSIGWLYERGRGIAQDYVEAMWWYRKAADRGNTFAQTRMEKLKGP